MDHVGPMLRSHPRAAQDDVEVLERAVGSLLACAQACTSCADACLAEDDVSPLRRCIRTNLDCADVCAATGRLASRRTDTDWAVVRAQLEACVVACGACAAECEGHAAHMEHCRHCAQACRSCEAACSELLRVIHA